MGHTALVLLYAVLLGVGVAALRMAGSWIGLLQVRPRSRRRQWWPPRLMLFVAFFVKAYLDQPLNQIAHHQPPPLPWSGVGGHLLQYCVDAIVLTVAVEVITSAGLYLKLFSHRSSRRSIVVLQLIRVVVAAGAATAHDALSTDDLPVSLALVVLSTWALGLGAFHEVRESLASEDLERRPAERRHGSRRRPFVSWLLLGHVAAAFGLLTLVTDSFLKYLSSGAMVLVYAVVAAASDAIGDKVSKRADAAFDNWRGKK